MGMLASKSAERPFILKVAIATTGRRNALNRTLRELSKQSQHADEVILCPAAPEDCDEAALGALPYRTRVVRGNRGLTLQRNAILDQCGECDVLLYLDDDFYPATDYFGEVTRLFSTDSAVVGATGRVLADGATKGGIQHNQALGILRNTKPRRGEVNDTYSLYGCNMALRLSTVRTHRLRFDESLPLYGWLEDLDFTRQLARFGRTVKSERLTGVHLAVTSGRSAGLPVGYSQIANPWYLTRKGTLTPRRALKQVSRNVAANAYHFLKPEPWMDRRGRLQGNAIAALHLFLGRLDPKFVLELSGRPRG